jgi:hypothetical protein
MNKTNQREFCKACHKKWFDRDGNQRCSEHENISALFYFCCRRVIDTITQRDAAPRGDQITPRQLASIQNSGKPRYDEVEYLVEANNDPE